MSDDRALVCRRSKRILQEGISCRVVNLNEKNKNRQQKEKAKETREG
jgi:hypothetical protein